MAGWIWLRERPGTGQGLGIALAVAGVVLVGWDGLTAGVPGQWRGHLLFMGGAILIAIWYTGIRHWRISVIETLFGLLTLNLLIYIPIWLLLLPSGIAVTTVGILLAVTLRSVELNARAK